MEASPPTAPRYFIRVSPRLPLVLAGVVAVLLITHIGLQVYNFEVDKVDFLIRDLFNVDEENNIPTWYSNAALLLASGLALAIAGAKRREKDRDARLWLGLSVVFGVLALDEDAGLHETVNNVLSDAFQDAWLTWVIPALALLAVFVYFYVGFWRRLPPRTRWLFAAAGVLFVGGAVGVEYLTTQLVEKADTLAYNLLTALEEGMEMYGVVLFIHALVSYMRVSDDRPAAVAVEIGA